MSVYLRVMEIYQLANLNLMSKKTATLPHRNTRPAINYHSKRKRIVEFHLAASLHSHGRGDILGMDGE
jgi:hypothetical protein